MSLLSAARKRHDEHVSDSDRQPLVVTGRCSPAIRKLDGGKIGT
jgi:hypothetical protein